MDLLKKFRKSEQEEEDKNTPQLKWREKVYDEDNDSIKMYEVCSGYYETLDDCVKQKGLNF